MYACVLALSGAARAADAPGERPGGSGWEAGTEDGIVVHLRRLPGTPIHEVWVHVVLDVAALDLQETLTDPEHFGTFMPHLKESRYLGEPGPVSRVYTLIDPPVVGRRDYVSEVTLLEEVQPGGRGRFRQRWKALTDLLPERHGVVRLQHNQGSWLITPLGEGRADVLYQFSVAPGGMVPAALAAMGARRGVAQTLRAVEGEARRRAAQRTRAGASAPSPNPP